MGYNASMAKLTLSTALLFALLLPSCATINFQSIELSCSSLPNWASSSIVAWAIFSTIGFLISEWMGMSKKIKFNGIAPFLKFEGACLYTWIKNKLFK